MTKSYQRGPQGVRGDRWSGSKLTNLKTFQPFWSATEKVYSKYYGGFKNCTTPFIKVEKTHKDFVFPVTSEDIQAALDRVPSKFISGIKAILVPSGSKKQTKVVKSLLLYGEYWQECVFLHPYPRAEMTWRYDKTPNPTVLHEYQRAGAIVRPDRAGICISFDEGALRQFYLRDVLMHEIGHHVDVQRNRSRREREVFAEWFAREYGFRLWGIKG
jgi:hypothetical protein